MKVLFASLFIITAAGCSSAAALRLADNSPNEMKAGTASVIPADASKVIDRVAACFHFSGEINGDRSERDKEVASAMSKLRCGTIEQEADAMRKKYADNKAVLDSLTAASKL